MNEHVLLDESKQRAFKPAPAGETSYGDTIHASTYGLTDYAAHVRTLYDLYREGTGVALVIGQILRALHLKRGSVDVMEMRRLDETNKRIAAALLGLCFNPHRLSDNGLRGILTADEIDHLLDEH